MLRLDSYSCRLSKAWYTSAGTLSFCSRTVAFGRARWRSTMPIAASCFNIDVGLNNLFSNTGTDLELFMDIPYAPPLFLKLQFQS